LSRYRLYPVAFATSRRIAKDIELCGYHIPAGVRSLFFTFPLSDRRLSQASLRAKFAVCRAPNLQKRIDSYEVRPTSQLSLVIAVIPSPHFHGRQSNNTIPKIVFALAPPAMLKFMLHQQGQGGNAALAQVLLFYQQRRKNWDVVDKLPIWGITSTNKVAGEKYRVRPWITRRPLFGNCEDLKAELERDRESDERHPLGERLPIGHRPLVEWLLVIVYARRTVNDRSVHLSPTGWRSTGV